MKTLSSPPFSRLRRLFGTRTLTPFAEHFQGVLGTSLEVQVLAASRKDGQRAVQEALTEIDRLERVFSRFDKGSELNRWLNDAAHRPSPELSNLLRRAEDWRTLTGGAFHPGSEALTLLWRDAERSGTPPESTAISQVLERLQSPVWSEKPGWRPALPLNLNAFAKGHIVDSAARAAFEHGGAAEVLVNIGGDLRHLGGEGSSGVPVDVMNPRTPHANAAPLTRLLLKGRGLATSGGAFRGFVVGGEHVSHVLDPRTGWPVTEVVGASVLAPSCADADALATAFSVLSPGESLTLGGQLAGVECLLVLADGRQRRSPGVPQAEAL